MIRAEPARRDLRVGEDPARHGVVRRHRRHRAGASEGEGLGNKFLANIREADAICQVVRAFEDGDVVHVDGKVSPSSGDIETIHTELILADLQTLEKAVARLEKESRIKKESRPAFENAVAAQKVLEAGETLFAAGEKAGVDLAELRARAADDQAVHLRLQPRRGPARRRRPAGQRWRASSSRRPTRVPQRQARDGPHGDVRRGRGSRCSSRSGRRSPVSTSSRVSGSTPSGCRPT
jgi:hypothetical protein